MKRFVYINPAGQLGGGERSLIELVAAVGREFPDVERHVILGEAGPVAEKLRQIGATVEIITLPSNLGQLGDSGLKGPGALASLMRMSHAVPSALITMQSYIRKLTTHLHKLDPLLIHSNGIKTHILATLAKPKNVPLIWHIRDYLSLRPVIRWSLRWLTPYVDLAIANSRSTATDAKAVLGRVPVVAIANAVDTARFQPGLKLGTLLDELAGLPVVDAHVLRVGLLATYAIWKGQGVFLDAVSLLKNSAIPIRAYIIGSPLYATPGSQYSLAELQSKAQELGVKDRVGFIPFQADPAPIYRELDIVVHASTRPEPFGLTIAEAMSSGRAVIVADAGGAAELVTKGHDGWKHQPGNAADLATAIRTLAEQDELRNQLGKNARLTAESQFSVTRLGHEIAQAYRSLLAKRSASSSYSHR